MIKRYIHHNLIILLVILASYFLYFFSINSLAKNLSVLFGVFMFFIVNIFYHIKHTKAHRQVVFEYLLLSVLIYLAYLLVILF